MEEELEKFKLKRIINEDNIHKYIIFIFLLPFILYTRKINYVVAHSVIETLNTAICFSSVIIVVNSYSISKNAYFLFLGTAFGFVSFFNGLHCVVYMNNVYNAEQTINLAEQLNIAFRLIEGISILVSFFFLGKSLKKHRAFYFYIILSSILVYIIFFTNYFPTCFSVNVGKTNFSIICDYIFIFCMLLSSFLFFKNRKYFNKTTWIYMSVYLILAIIVRYMVVVNNFLCNDLDLWNHILKFMSYYFLYKALVENVITNPLNAIFIDLNSKNIDLESKTKELEKTIIKLNNEKNKTEKINKELENSRNNYQKLIEFLPDGVIFRRADKITYANTAAVRLFKAKDKEELIRQNPIELMHENSLDELTNSFKNSKKALNNSTFGEYRLKTLEGKTIYAEMKSTFLQIDNDDFYLTIIYDVSERKKARKVEKLLNEAKENEKLKTEFFANLSHELRTPINVIYSALQVLELKAKDEFSVKYNKIIKQNCYRLLRLINNIIDSTKIDAGFLTLNLTYNNIVSVVEDIALSVSSYVEMQGMNLIFDTDVEEKYCNIDLDAIERIILNLISNAVKFRRDNGNIYINIFDKGDSIIISVKDDGIGIPSEQQNFVFDKFKQVDKSFTRNKEGSGIGLSLVKALVELHNGNIKLKSEENVGSEFIIEIPIEKTLKTDAKYDNFCNANIIKNIDIEFSDIYL